MKRDFCLNLEKNKIIEFIELVDKRYTTVLMKELEINNQPAIEATCINNKNKIMSYLFTDLNAWYSNAPAEYSKKVLTPKWIEYLEKIFGEEYIQSLPEKINIKYNNYKIQKNNDTKLNEI